MTFSHFADLMYSRFQWSVRMRNGCSSPSQCRHSLLQLYGELPALHISLMCSLVLVFLKRRHRSAILQGYHGKTAPTKFSDVLTSTTNGSEGSGLWHMGALVKCSLGLGKLEWLPATSRESWVFFLRVIFLFKRGHYFAKTSNEPTIKKITNLRYLFSDYVDLGLVHFYTSFINPEILLHTFPDSPTDCYIRDTCVLLIPDGHGL